MLYTQLFRKNNKSANTSSHCRMHINGQTKPFLVVKMSLGKKLGQYLKCQMKMKLGFDYALNTLPVPAVIIKLLKLQYPQCFDRLLSFTSNGCMAERKYLSSIINLVLFVGMLSYYQWVSRTPGKDWLSACLPSLTAAASAVAAAAAAAPTDAVVAVAAAAAPTVAVAAAAAAPTDAVVAVA